MSGWVALALLAALAVAALRLLGTRGSLLQLAAAAVLFGCAGYALQGSPGLAGSPRDARTLEAPVPVTEIRHAFFGHFSGAETWLTISESLARTGETEDSVNVLQNAVRKYPADPELWIGLGNALVDHAGMLTPASVFAYQRAAQLAPGHPAPPFFMGLALARSGDRGGALALWKQVLQAAPPKAEWRPMVEQAVAALSTPPRSPH